jgi:membrane-bound lytic murein transglycosylase MltF
VNGGAWLAVAAMLLCVTACGNTPPPEEDKAAAQSAPQADTGTTTAEAAEDARVAKPSATTDATPEEPENAVDPDAERRVVMNQPWTGDLDGMVEREHIRALVIPSKTFYFIEKGQQRGTAYESMKAFEEELNKSLGRKNLKVHVVFIVTTYDNLIPALVEGRGDIALGGLTITEGRLEKVDFANPTWTGVSEIAVTGPASPPLATLDDLAGKEVVVRPSSSYWEHLEALNARFAAEGKQPVVLKAAPEELRDEDLLEMLNAGAFGIAVVDDYVANLWAKVFTDIRPHPEVAVATGGDIGWMIRKDSPQLKERLNAFVKTHGKGTLFGNTIVKRYTGTTQFIKSATSSSEVAKFKAVVDLFRNYSGQYDMDTLLMIAQGYQESRLDQSVRSPVGAIGIMQVMPATGGDLGVGDISQLEPNIHAGVKYMRWMIDTYYKDEPMTPVNKALFAFASYNAGPNRMRQLRRDAEARGLDPNVWFGNVEVVAAEKVGAETVTYVSNIFKYAVAYKLFIEEEQKREAAKEALADAPS